MAGIYTVDLSEYIEEDRADDLAQVLDNICNKLVRAGDDENVDEEGREFFILHDALGNESGDVASMLIKDHRASCSVLDNWGDPAAQLIAQARDPLPLFRKIEKAVGSNTRVMEELVEANDGDQRTMLWHAFRNFGENHYQFIKALVDAGANVFHRDCYGYNLLHALYPICCPKEYSEDQKRKIITDYMLAIRLLFERSNINVNQRSLEDYDGVTPLMHICSGDWTTYNDKTHCMLPTLNKVTSLLIEKGAETKLNNTEGDNALELLMRYHYDHADEGENEDDQDYFQTIRSLLKKNGRKQLHFGSTTTMFRGSPRELATQQFMTKTLATFWESEVYSWNHGTRQSAILFLRETETRGKTLLHSLCRFYNWQNRTKCQEEGIMDKRLKTFELLYGIAERHGLLGEMDASGSNILHLLCFSIQKFAMIDHPVFRFVLERAGTFNSLWTTTNGQNETPIQNLGAKEEMGKFNVDKNNALEDGSLYAVDLYADKDHVLPEKLDLVYYDPEINSLVFRGEGTSTGTIEETKND